MATYGIGTQGFVPFTGFTGTLGSGPANVPSSSGQVYFNGISQGDERLAKIFRAGQKGKAFKGLWIALTGAVAGSTPSVSTVRVKGTPFDSAGGLVALETVVDSRPTTAGDVTALIALLNRTVYPATYPADVSGNGGGGQLGR